MVQQIVYALGISQKMHHAIAKSTIAAIPGAPHVALFEAPERTSQAALEWATGIG